MEELNNLENMNFSGSPEYIDVFNDGISTAAEEEYGASPALCLNCENGNLELTCTPNVGNTALTDNCTLGEGCTLGEACVVGIEDPTPTPSGSTTSTTYQVKFNFGIKVRSHLLNGKNGYIGNATINGWGHSLILKYTNTTNNFFTSGNTYAFSYNPSTLGVCYTHGKSKTNISTLTSLRSFISGITAASHTFIVVSLDGHDIPNNKKITCTVKYKSGTTSSNIDSPKYTSADTVNTLSLSAKTYYITYDSNYVFDSSTYEEIVKNNIKIGTKFSVYSDSNKTKTATTINNYSYYTYSVGYRASADTYSFRPYHRFIINTSAKTIYVKQERCGESFETTINLNPSGDVIPILPPMQTSGKLATLKTLYDSSTGLGITSFQKMFSSETSSKGNMVLTPNNYEKLFITDEKSGTTHYSYTRPKMYYSASTNSSNYCLKINDISTFDKNIYLVSTGYTNPAGGVILTPNIVHDKFTQYKNYPLTNVKNGSDWSTSGGEKKYFTFYL